jgi:hypothetical protein
MFPNKKSSKYEAEATSAKAFAPSLHLAFCEGHDGEAHADGGE